MSKIKMRCTTCGKWFQSANAKEVTCPDCVQKARKEKLAAKTAQSSSSIKQGQVQGTVNPTRPSPPSPPKPKPATGGTSHWIDTVEGVKVSEPEKPKPKLPSSPAPRDTRGGTATEEVGSRGPGGYREERGPDTYREGPNRGPAGYRPAGPGISGGIGQRPRQPMEGGFGRGPRPAMGGEARPERYRPDAKKGGKPPKAKTPRPPTPPKPKREKIPPPAPFTPTPEQIAQVEARYIELAVPAEFDGIRTQIAQEMGIPKKAVKKIVKDLRERQSIPSWWELQTYKGSSEELEKIKALYVPHLPLPPIGVHKTIAEELSLNPGDIYQAIKAIRLEMNLPQYNDPALHGLEPITGDKKRPATPEQEKKESQENKIEASATTLETPGESTKDEAPVVETPGESTEAEVTIAQAPVESVEVATSSTVDRSNAHE
jgi:predicted  nucleic acid-binding Zn-ribbon protein